MIGFESQPVPEVPSFFSVTVNPSHLLRPSFIFSTEPSLIPLAHSGFSFSELRKHFLSGSPLRFFVFRLCNQSYFYGCLSCSAFMSCLFNWIADFLRSRIMCIVFMSSYIA